MNRPILNRDSRLPDDGWYEIEVPGEHYNAEANVVQVLDASAFESIVNRFKADAAKENFAGLLVDRDHFSTDSDKPTEALGWMQDIRNRDGHLEGKIDWTGVGKPLVEGKAYKFFSTVYDRDDVQPAGSREIKNRKTAAVRPLRLDRLALTNDPNNKGGRPISNRKGNPADAAEKPTTTMKSLLKELGLEEGASEESAVAALQAIKNRAGQADAFKTERDALLATQVEADLTKFAPVIKNREAVKKALLANRASALEFLEAMQPPAEPAGQHRITNRAAAKAPATDAGSDPTVEASAKEGVRAAKIVNRALVIQREQKIPYQSAFAKAAEEIPAEA